MTNAWRLAACLTLALLAGACGGGGSSPTSPTSAGTSSGGSSTSNSASASSHNAGTDCTSCHRFTVAGTAYQSSGTATYPGAVIRLTSAANGGGTVVLSLTADRSGNFYSESAVAFGQGLYVTATGTSGTITAKSGPITSGACNRCHTASQRIRVG